MISKLDNHKQVMFAVFCAKQILHISKPKHRQICLKAIDAAEGFLYGRVSKQECMNAYADAAYYTKSASYAAGAYAAAANTAIAAGGNHAALHAYAAAYCTVYAAGGSNENKVIVEQNKYYDELLNFDKIVEEILGVQR
jgi:hypothetical protein